MLDDEQLVILCHNLGSSPRPGEFGLPRREAFRMYSRIVMAALFALACFAVCAPAAQAAPQSYAAFTAGAKATHGLFTIWQKDGKTYMELAPGQLDTDYLETIVPGNGLAQQPLWWGDTDYLPTELVRFERRGDQIVILWPNWYAQAPGSPSNQLADLSNFPDSVTGIGDIAAEDSQTGNVIFDLSSLMTDELDIRNIIDENLKPDEAYRLDPSLSYFDQVKAFPKNDVITVAQTWSTDAKHVIDTAPDARRLQIKVVYNFIQLPHDDYRPRLADDRVGIYDDIYDDFSNDHRGTRLMRYLVRWNFDPADPNRPSVARHPMVITLSNTIPPQYRQAITDACLEWNKAYAKIGILDAIKVQPQPSDPNFDPDDYRYNVIRWLNETQPAFGADSQTLFNPLTGEEIHTGVLVSAVEGLEPGIIWKYEVDPVRYGRTTDPVPAKFVHDSIFAALVHEMGHNQGLQHNFIGHEAYSEAQLQSMAFTSKHGIASSAMEYTPLNLWPQPYQQGEYFQTTLGPYDYYAIKYGYANIPGAKTPEQELPTLRRWASAWSNPWTRYASDEDVSWGDGHAADPRVEQDVLSNTPLNWCNTQMAMDRAQMAALGRYWPREGRSYAHETQGFAMLLRGYLHCASVPAHYIGGQYLSRAHRGDPGASAPIVPVSLATEHRAFDILDRALFADDVLPVPASTLQDLSYSEWAGYGYTGWEGYGNLPTWAYNPPERHDFPLVEDINRTQMGALNFFFQPLVLQRIDDNPIESRGATMTMADLFDWIHSGVYGDLRNGTIPLVKRNLQIQLVDRLAQLVSKPDPGTPADAESLARAELGRIAHDSAAALRAHHDPTTQAHLTDLVHRANAALKA